MKRSKMFVFLSLIVLFSMALSACAQATTVAPTAVPDEL
jgi:outer membrane lipoprotein-sorting protein